MDHLQRWSRGHKYKKTGGVPLFKMSHEHPGPYHESLRGGGGGGEKGVIRQVTFLMSGGFARILVRRDGKVF